MENDFINIDSPTHRGLLDFFIKKDRIEYFIFTSTNLSMYTTTEARESHCNFRGTKQETSKLLQVARFPSWLGFIPGVSNRGRAQHTVDDVRTGRIGRGGREEGGGGDSTHGAHQNKNRNMKTSRGVLQGSFYHSDLVSSPGTNPSHPDDVCAGLD